MFLRSSDGTKYVNSQKLTRLEATNPGAGWEVSAVTANYSAKLCSAASEADARVARDKVIAVLRGISEGSFFLVHYQLSITYPAQAVEALTTFNGGAGQWQVRADGNNLAVTLADQTAATAAMDSIAAAVGALDVAKLVA